LEFKDRSEKYTPPTSMAAGTFVGTEPQLRVGPNFRSLVAAEGRAGVKITESEGASREISSRQWIPEDEAYDHLVVKFSRE
jgi:hypothetical protein